MGGYFAFDFSVQNENFNKIEKIFTKGIDKWKICDIIKKRGNVNVNVNRNGIMHCRLKREVRRKAAPKDRENPRRGKKR